MYTLNIIKATKKMPVTEILSLKTVKTNWIFIDHTISISEYNPLAGSSHIKFIVSSRVGNPLFGGTPPPLY